LPIQNLLQFAFKPILTYPTNFMETWKRYRKNN